MTLFKAADHELQFQLLFCFYQFGNDLENLVIWMEEEKTNE